MKVFIEGLVFCEVPADTDAQAQALALEQIHFSGLLGDESRLALREDHDARCEFDSLCYTGQKGKKGEWLGELIAIRYGDEGKPTSSVPISSEETSRRISQAIRGLVHQATAVVNYSR
jgi:hypothetical protein